MTQSHPSDCQYCGCNMLSSTRLYCHWGETLRRDTCQTHWGLQLWDIKTSVCLAGCGEDTITCGCSASLLCGLMKNTKVRGHWQHTEGRFHWLWTTPWKKWSLRWVRAVPLCAALTETWRTQAKICWWNVWMMHRRDSSWAFKPHTWTEGVWLCSSRMEEAAELLQGSMGRSINDCRDVDESWFTVLLYVNQEERVVLPFVQRQDCFIWLGGKHPMLWLYCFDLSFFLSACV